MTKKYNGFRSTITVDRNKYAFFSVPYDRGFSAYVNGEKVKILESNGMMAVPLKTGMNEIQFMYINYNLIIGVISTMIFLILWLCYNGGIKRRKVK